MIKIRKLRKQDIDAASAIVTRNYSPAYGRLARAEVAAMFDLSAVSRPTYYAAIEGNRLLGFAGYVVSWMDYEVANIFWVNVDPDHQKRGIGKLLINTLIAKAQKDKAINLVLLTTKTPAYYRKHFGFRTISKFGPNQDHLMELKVDR